MHFFPSPKRHCICIPNPYKLHINHTLHSDKLLVSFWRYLFTYGVILQVHPAKHCLNLIFFGKTTNQPELHQDIKVQQKTTPRQHFRAAKKWQHIYIIKEQYAQQQTTPSCSSSQANLPAGQNIVCKQLNPPLPQFCDNNKSVSGRLTLIDRPNTPLRTSCRVKTFRLLCKTFTTRIYAVQTRKSHIYKCFARVTPHWWTNSGQLYKNHRLNHHCRARCYFATVISP